MALLLIFIIMIDPFTGGLLGGIGSAFGNMISGDHNAKTQHKYAMQQMAQQQKYQLEQMQQQDKYNKGFQQMLWEGGANAQVSGLRNSGLNPAGASSQIGAQTAGNSVSGGSVSANGANPGVDLAGSAMAGFQAYAQYDMQKKQNDANVKLANSQAELASAQAADQRWKNSPGYRNAVMSGLNEKAAADHSLSQWYDNESSLTDAKKNLLVSQAAELVSRSGVNEAQQGYLTAKTCESVVQAKAILQGISESKQRMALMKSQETVQHALKNNYDASTGLIVSQTETENQTRSGKVKNLEADFQVKGQQKHNMETQNYQDQLNNWAINYANECLAALPPEKRATMEGQRHVMNMLKDAGDLLFKGALSTSSISSSFQSSGRPVIGSVLVNNNN